MMSDEVRAVEEAFTADEVHLLTCALAGNFPPSLNRLRPAVLRKLVEAHGGPKARIAKQQAAASTGREETGDER